MQVAAAAAFRRLTFPLALLAGVVAPSEAADPPPLVCYGVEPTWRLDLAAAEARLAVSGEEEKDYSGRYTSLDQAKVYAWRGHPAAGAQGEVVSIVNDDSCDDGVSDQRRPYNVRLSLPDGRLFVGCCRLATVWNGADATRQAQAPPRPSVAAPAPAAHAPAASAPAGSTRAGSAPVATDWAAEIVSFLPALRTCTFEALRTEAVVFAEKRPDHSVHMVLRLPSKVYADCEVGPSGTVKLNQRTKDKPLLPQEQAAVLTLFPGAPPREPCYKSDAAVDSEGNPFGWISRKGC